MKATKLILFPILAMALAVGCSSGSHESASLEAGDPGVQQAPKDPASKPNLTSNKRPAMERDVTKTGSLTVQVDQVDAAEKKSRAITESAGGRVDKVSSTDLAGPTATIDMTLRVPVQSFESVIEKIEALGTRMSKQVAIDDVTEQLVDFNVRVKKMQDQETELRGMLRRAGNVNDSLTIRNDLARLQGEIESLMAQKKSLSGQAAFSTLELKLSQKANATAMASTDPNWFQTSWASAWGAGSAAFRVLIGILMWVVVFAPIWIVAALGFRWLVKTSNQASQQTPSPSEGQPPL